MDKSKEYINMCEKAVEIHNHRLTFLDWVWWKVDMGYVVAIKSIYHHADKPETYVAGNLGTHNHVYREDLIWLPRQDQLQEMVLDCIDGSCGKNLSRLKQFGQFAFDVKNFMISRSMEQLWLAFVMKEKYNKVWDKEEWRDV